ncbi:MAG TPA: MotA/TolQ/ExbB proton channel family protein [Tepidisphaeraceae bacterium]|nr:MotA/TolQ/ExbB proton channel family protein [Tepidisphaeraceae bacterium]
MDLATLIGYVIAWGCIGFGVFHASHGAVGAYVNPTELAVVGGCALGATIAAMPMHSIIAALGATKKMLFAKDVHVEHLIKEMVQYAETARRDGVLALESVAREAHDPFLRRGLQLTIDGTDPEIIERILRIEIEAMIERHKHGKHFWASIAKFGPGCGLLACLVAQIAMFSNLDGDAGVIGRALSGALTGTLYGAALQNVVAGPIAEKLGLRSKEEAFVKEIVMQGVLSIQAGNNPRVVEMQLMSFLSVKQQAAIPKAA